MKKLLTILCITSAVTSQLVGADISGDNVRATAGDVFISDNSLPAVKFIDNPSVSTAVDWSIFGHDDHISINQSTGGAEVLSISHNASATKSLVVDSTGDMNLADGSVFIDKSANRVGIGTVIPSSNLDIKSSDNAEIALENGSGSARWIIRAGTNTKAFYLVDQTNDSKRPFYVESNTSSNTLYLNSTGNIGVGTPSPNAKLDVRGDIKATFSGAGTESVYRLLTLSANDTDGTGPSEAGFVLNNAKAGKEWLFRTIDDGKAFTATLAGTGGSEFKVSSPTGAVAGTQLFLGNGAKNVGGVWINASSRTLKENIKPLSTQEALTAFSKLQPVTYNYKTDKTEKVLGFIAEDVPDLVAINSRDGLSAMDMVALLTKVTQEQAQQLEAQAKKIVNLEKMQQRLTKVESLLTNLALKTSKSQEEMISLNK